MGARHEVAGLFRRLRDEQGQETGHENANANDSQCHDFLGLSSID
jgi:hypothetical protein